MRLPAALLACLFVLAAGCGGSEETAPTAQTVEGTVPAETSPPAAEGDASAGKEIYAAQGCGSCHVFEAAGSSGQTGPNLDESLEGKDAEYVRESIVNPDAQIAEGFQPGIMPKNYEDTLSDKQLADLVAFLTNDGS